MQQLTGRNQVKLDQTNPNSPLYGNKQCLANVIDSLTVLKSVTPSNRVKVKTEKLIERLVDDSIVLEKLYGKHDTKVKAQTGKHQSWEGSTNTALMQSANM